MYFDIFISKYWELILLSGSSYEERLFGQCNLQFSSNMWMSLLTNTIYGAVAYLLLIVGYNSLYCICSSPCKNDEHFCEFISGTRICFCEDWVHSKMDGGLPDFNCVLNQMHLVVDTNIRYWRISSCSISNLTAIKLSYATGSV